MTINNIFEGVNPTNLDNEIKSLGANGVYKPGVHTAIGAEIVLFETIYEGQATVKANIILTTDTGGVLIDELKVTSNSNQAKGTTNLTLYMHNIAKVTGLADAVNALMANFGSTMATLPKVKYTDAYKKEYDAVSIRVFNNAKFKFMTHSEVSGSANGIFTKQRLVLNQLFRFADNASLGEIKDSKTEVGGSYVYWTTDVITCAAKTQVAYSKNRHDSDTEVLEVIVDFLKTGKLLSKDQRLKIQAHWNADYARTVLSGKVSANTSIDTSTIDAEDDGSDQPSFG